MTRLSGLLLLAALAAPGVAHADDEIVHTLEALAAPDSDGGATITAAEAAAFAATVPETLSGDEAILGIVVANRLRFAPRLGPSQTRDLARGERSIQIADEDYGAIQRALRYRVDGLAIGLLQAPGLALSRRHPEAQVSASFDAQGVGFDRVDLIYTWDGWATTRAVSLRPGQRWTGELGVAPATGRLHYAVHVFGPDGRDFWLNYGLERGVHGGQGFHDFSLDLAALHVPRVKPSRPALVKLLHTFTHPSSDGGNAITSDEVSLTVEQLTWDGGPGVQDDDVLHPAIAEVDRLVEEGNDFQIDDAILRGFLDRQRLRYASLPPAALERSAAGDLRMHFSIGIASAEVHYSTDGWNLPYVATCARERSGVTCSLGHIPRGALFAYAVRLIYPDGTSSWQYADRGLGRPSNFYQKAP